ncbi:MAG TPA: hypothetical protein VL360_07110 [Gammaproteobacteria bacterium]|jgi:hypothetical protein|nr:hypothetical protein [Gammaproteobacteria bacterium]
MKWKKQHSNLLIVSLLTLAYTAITLMMLIGPLHVNSVGEISRMGALSLYSLVYWIFAIWISWTLFTVLRKRPALSFFVLLIVGMILILGELFLFTR